MKVILIGFILLAIVTAQRLDFNSPNCNKYLQKFGTANNPDGTGATKMAFTGDIAFVAGKLNSKKEFDQILSEKNHILKHTDEDEQMNPRVKERSDLIMQKKFKQNKIKVGKIIQVKHDEKDIDKERRNAKKEKIRQWSNEKSCQKRYEMDRKKYLISFYENEEQSDRFSKSCCNRMEILLTIIKWCIDFTYTSFVPPDQDLNDKLFSNKQSLIPIRISFWWRPKFGIGALD